MASTTKQDVVASFRTSYGILIFEWECAGLDKKLMFSSPYTILDDKDSQTVTQKYLNRPLVAGRIAENLLEVPLPITFLIKLNTCPLHHDWATGSSARLLSYCTLIT